MKSQEKSSVGAVLAVKQERAIILMARGLNISEVAKEVGVSEQTIYNWKRDDLFVSALRAETMSCLMDCRRSLGALAARAIETLADLLSSENPHVRLKAATSIMAATGLHALDVEQFLIMGLGIESKGTK